MPTKFKCEKCRSDLILFRSNWVCQSCDRDRIEAEGKSPISAAKALATAARKIRLYLETAQKKDADVLLNMLWDIESAVSRLRNSIKIRRFLITHELAEACNLKMARIRQLAPELERLGLARKESGIWRFLPAAVEAVKGMPGPGRPSKVSSEQKAVSRKQ